MNRVIKASFGLMFKIKNLASFDCENCKKKLQNPECKACHRMISYFNVFQIPQKYEIDSSEIKKKAKNLQKEFHPDKHTVQNQKQKFQQYSAYINNAKSTLLDDLKRAQYMMELKGVKIDEETKIDDNEFMMDMFELQEEIEATTDQKELTQLLARLQTITKELIHEFQKFFRETNLQKCKEFLYKYKYFYRAVENVKIKLNQS